MANKKHVNIIEKGIKDWNLWREENPAIIPNFESWACNRAYLCEANLRGAKLCSVKLSNGNLKGATLCKANLFQADLINVNLSMAELCGATLNEANLRGANFSKADLRKAKLHQTKLRGANFRKAKLSEADLSEANLSGTDFTSANLKKANLRGVDLRESNLSGAILADTDLNEANLRGSNLTSANLTRANLKGANLKGADLSAAKLIRANLSEANLSEANLREADLREANLRLSQLVKTRFNEAILTDCLVFGISAWGLELEGSNQTNLIVTSGKEPIITVDNLEVAQFVYLLLHNEKIRHVIDTITSKVVLILGRFTEERKAVLDAIRDVLRDRGLAPVLFDFDKPESKDITGTVETLARMARFILADLTDPSSIPHELATIVPFMRTTPVVPIRLKGSGGYSMFDDLEVAYNWVLPKYEYENDQTLIESVSDKIIEPAAAKLKELQGR